MANYLCKLLIVLVVLITWTGETTQAVPLSAFAQHQQFLPVRVTPQDVHCLTRAIYYEAAHESRAGKEAVALVVINRVVNRHYPNTICGVITQSALINEIRICQFSFHCEPPRPTHRKTWDECYLLAKRVLTNNFDRVILTKLENVTYFHAVYVHPQWSKHKVFVTQIDHHLFYKESH